MSLPDRTLAEQVPLAVKTMLQACAMAEPWLRKGEFDEAARYFIAGYDDVASAVRLMRRVLPAEPE